MAHRYSNEQRGNADGIRRLPGPAATLPAVRVARAQPALRVVVVGGGGGGLSAARHVKGLLPNAVCFAFVNARVARRPQPSSCGLDARSRATAGCFSAASIRIA